MKGRVSCVSLIIFEFFTKAVDFHERQYVRFNGDVAGSADPDCSIIGSWLSSRGNLIIDKLEQDLCFANASHSVEHCPLLALQCLRRVAFADVKRSAQGIKILPLANEVHTRLRQTVTRYERRLNGRCCRSSTITCDRLVSRCPCMTMTQHLRMSLLKTES